MSPDIEEMSDQHKKMLLDNYRPCWKCGSPAEPVNFYLLTDKDFPEHEARPFTMMCTNWNYCGEIGPFGATGKEAADGWDNLYNTKPRKKENKPETTIHAPVVAEEKPPAALPLTRKEKSEFEAVCVLHQEKGRRYERCGEGLSCTYPECWRRAWYVPA